MYLQRPSSRFRYPGRTRALTTVIPKLRKRCSTGRKRMRRRCIDRINGNVNQRRAMMREIHRERKNIIHEYWYILNVPGAVTMFDMDEWVNEHNVKITTSNLPIKLFKFNERQINANKPSVAELQRRRRLIRELAKERESIKGYILNTGSIQSYSFGRFMQPERMLRYNRRVKSLGLPLEILSTKNRPK